MPHSYRLRLLVITAALCAALSLTVTAQAQTEDDGSIRSAVGLPDVLPLPAANTPWVDPFVSFGLQELPAAETPSFDFAVLNATPLFEVGVEALVVSDPPDVSVEAAQHLRSLQAVATIDLAVETNRTETEVAAAAITQTDTTVAARRREIQELDTELRAAQLVAQDVLAELAAEQAYQGSLEAEIAGVSEAVVDLAIQAFIGEAESPLETFLEDPDSNQHPRQRVVTDELRVTQRQEVASLEARVLGSLDAQEQLNARLSDFQRTESQLVDAQAQLHTQIQDLQTQRTSYEEQIAEAEAQAADLLALRIPVSAYTQVSAAHYQEAFQQRITEFVRGTNLPLVALNAYVRASRVVAQETPECGVHWSQLAGIGRIESFHGYFGESTLDAQGNTTSSILGIPLNGTNNTQVIRDSDNGVYDGDRVFDRALGPMQFIPTTWELYGSDGNGDGVRDPQNVYDSTLAAARYLCAAPGSMLTLEGEQAGYWAYNHDLTYSRNVTREGRNYFRLVNVAPEPAAFAAFAAQPTLEQVEQVRMVEELLAEQALAETSPEEGEQQLTAEAP